ncbi:hypothetical protein [Chondromyces apiculatus]|uniref:Uncharacterized protein n=1 Tax=Chondromyces apiculatus DSM 436 TaxID=1192034 RepID=A0A017SX86_9BACT|nr:hypothetical protein [Chondromyces apiculatus]EYF01235.1 Hypothetical protein CAP_8488 [Chondromyces apiculatus DSM 436]
MIRPDRDETHRDPCNDAPAGTASLKPLKDQPMKTLLVALSLLMLGGCAADSAHAPGTAQQPTPDAIQETSPVQPPSTGHQPDPVPPPPDPHVTAKVQAPVDITAEPTASTASIAILFRADATDVTVSVWGADGLVLHAPPASTPNPARTARAGERVPLQVSYTPPATAATLAVQVTGTFGARRLSSVRSFTVGRGDPPPAATAAGELSTDSKGRPIRVMRPQ